MTGMKQDLYQPQNPTLEQRTERWHDTHDRIIETAADLFYQHGINGVGVDTIAETAEVTKATLYSHFKSKDGLIAECLDVLDTRYHEWFVRQVRQRSKTPNQHIDTAFEVLDEWFHHQRFRGCAFINATIELTDNNHPGRRAVEAHKQRTITFIQELLVEANVNKPSELAQEIMLLMEGATITALVQNDLGAARRAGNIAKRLLHPHRNG